MDISKIITQSDDRLFNYLSKEAFISFFSDEPKKSDKSVLILLGLITIVGTDPLKVLLRKNIGKLALSLPRLIMAAVLYFLWALLIYSLIESSSSNDFPFWFSATALWPILIFYVLLGVIVIILGVSEHSKGKLQVKQDMENLIYRGDSLFFNAMDNKQKARVWSLYEPLSCLVISLLLTFFNPFLGAPLIATSISFWVNEVFQVNNVWNIVGERVGNYQMRIAHIKPFKSENDDFVVE